MSLSLSRVSLYRMTSYTALLIKQFDVYRFQCVGYQPTKVHWSILKPQNESRAESQHLLMNQTIHVRT